ncbi:MAG: tRNA (adenosine(37)-N6)-threonylcarbamoyltransferase complex ATPase subunit type 1 TsaE [Alphaproteobacteria bacterium]|nr:tRNA (adenosine(37)-N6)-threonylcarbamoyltransferase complex ATPase subunit type 1 TsaE [Alphaproteobacteria bacterium]
METDIEIENEQAMEAAAQRLAGYLENGDIVLLHGPLGAGKSVFARALIRTLSGDPALEVPSPTFTLVQYYESEKGPLWHYDLYRIEDYEEILPLGWEDSLADGITIVEWPERLGPLKPLHALDIHIHPVQDKPEKRILRMDSDRLSV